MTTGLCLCNVTKKQSATVDIPLTVQYSVKMLPSLPRGSYGESVSVNGTDRSPGYITCWLLLLKTRNSYNFGTDTVQKIYIHISVVGDT